MSAKVMHVFSGGLLPYLSMLLQLPLTVGMSQFLVDLSARRPGGIDV